MNTQEYLGLCHRIRNREEVFVENEDTRYTARVVGCQNDRLEVEYADRRESWPRVSCMETMGSRFNHKEKSLDAPPWSFDRFNPFC